jgi:integrase
MRLRINFALKAGVKGEIPVQAIMTFGQKEIDLITGKTIYKRLRYYTGVKVKSEEWNKTEKLPYHKTPRAQLVQIESTIQQVYSIQLAMNGSVTCESLKAALDEKLKGKKQKSVQRIRFTEFIETEIISDADMKRWTKYGYEHLKSYIEDFEKVYGRPVYNHEFDDRVFRLFMAEVRRKNNRYNSVTNIYKTLRATLNKIKRTYKVPVFNPTEELPKAEKQANIKPAKVYLNFEQIHCVMNYKPQSKQQENVKLIFLTLLFTGCRYSDVFKIKPEGQFSKTGIKFAYGHYISLKTNIEVIVPILKPLADAISANGGKTAEKMDLSEFNRALKTLVRDCGLTEPVTLTYTDSYGNKQFEQKPFCDFVSSHTGRRSFVSNLINHIPDTILSKITGHDTGNSSASMIHGYNQIQPIDSAVLFYRTLSRLQSIDKEHFVFKLA